MFLHRRIGGVQLQGNLVDEIFTEQTRLKVLQRQVRVLPLPFINQGRQEIGEVVCRKSQ